MQTVNLFGALVLGIMGAGHCLAMCGGIISSLSMSSSSSGNKKNWYFVIIYQIGRITSYTLFGAVAGWLGLKFSQISPLPILKVLSGALLIFMSLYVSQIWMGLKHIENLGQFLWKKISPLSKKLLPVTNAKQALLLGSLWGWLPCGLVYTSLSYAISLGDSLSSAKFMLIFGIGTLPATILAGGASLSLKNFLNNRLVRIFSAILFLLMGVFTLYTVVMMTGNNHHH